LYRKGENKTKRVLRINRSSEGVEKLRNKLENKENELRLGRGQGKSTERVVENTKKCCRFESKRG